MFNLIVGTGALTLPSVFAQAGWALSIFLLIMLAFMGFVTVTFIIETMACSNAMIQLNRIQSHKIDGESEVINTSDSEADNENTPIMSNRSRYYTLNQCVQLGEMTQLFFNKTGRFLFYVSLCVYLYGDLSIYTAAISKTLTDLSCDSPMSDGNSTNSCWHSYSVSQMDVYRIFVAVFIIIVGPFSYFNLQKTKYLQVATSSMRWCAFMIMISIAIVRILELGVQGHPPVASVRHVPHLIGACVYSFMCHHSLPGLVAPFHDKSHVVKQLGLDYMLICLFYLVLAVTGSFAFDHLQDLYTLNFVPVSKDGWFTECIEYFLGLFPVFTLSTSFPIIAITLQSNLKSLCLDPYSMERYNFFVRYLLFPTLAIVPPALIAITTHNLGSLVSFTGTYAGSAIQYLIPAFLVLSARRHCQNKIGGVNKYGSPFQGILWVSFVIVWCITCVSLSTINLFFSET